MKGRETENHREESVCDLDRDQGKTDNGLEMFSMLLHKSEISCTGRVGRSSVRVAANVLSVRVAANVLLELNSRKVRSLKKLMECYPMLKADLSFQIGTLSTP